VYSKSTIRSPRRQLCHRCSRNTPTDCTWRSCFCRHRRTLYTWHTSHLLRSVSSRSVTHHQQLYSDAPATLLHVTHTHAWFVDRNSRRLCDVLSSHNSNKTAIQVTSIELQLFLPPPNIVCREHPVSGLSVWPTVRCLSARCPLAVNTYSAWGDLFI